MALYGRTTKNYCDEFDQLVRVVDAEGKVSQFDYDKGKLIQGVDANLNSTTYEYEKLKRFILVSFLRLRLQPGDELLFYEGLL